MRFIKLLLLTLLYCIPLYSQKYFPLETGNKWHFELSHWNSDKKDTFTVSVVGDTLMSNGFEYYILSKSLDPAELLSPFVRVDSSYIYFYDESDSMDTPVYDINATPQEYYHIGLYATESDSPRVQLSFIDTTQIFGEQSNNIIFSLDWLVPFELTFSDKFGPLGWWSAHHEPVWTTLIGCKISGLEYGIVVNLNQQHSLPIEYELSQNYPNPFNLTTTIKFTIPVYSIVKLKVIDSIGRNKEILVNKYLPVGEHFIHFNASNYSSGVYYFQLITGQYISTKKLMLIK